MNGRAVALTGGTYGKRFGVNKKLGILFTGSFDYNGLGIDNIQPALDPFSTFAQPFYDDNTIRQYRYYRYRDGGRDGHETAHVCAHHAVRQKTRMNYAQFSTIPLILIGG